MAIGLGDLKKKSTGARAKNTTKERKDIAQPWSAEGLTRKTAKTITNDDESTTYAAPLFFFDTSHDTRLKLAHEVLVKIEEHVTAVISGPLKTSRQLAQMFTPRILKRPRL